MSPWGGIFPMALTGVLLQLTVGVGERCATRGPRVEGLGVRASAALVRAGLRVPPRGREGAEPGVPRPRRSPPPAELAAVTAAGGRRAAGSRSWECAPGLSRLRG